MCEGVGEDLRHGAWYVGVRVGKCIFLLECVSALRWGVALVGEFLY